MKSNLKLLYIFAIIVLANTYAKAQFKAGESFLDGSLMINHSNYGNYVDNNASSIVIGYGKFISKNTANTFSLNVGYQNTSSDIGLYGTKNFNIGLNKGRQYYKSIFGKIGIYGGFTGGIRYNNLQSTNPENGDILSYTDRTTNQIGINFQGAGGLIYRLNDKWAFTGNLINLNVADISYSWTDGKKIPTQGGSTNSFTEKRFDYNFNPNISFSYGIGIRYIIK